jgi:hypothetical protein
MNDADDYCGCIDQREIDGCGACVKWSALFESKGSFEDGIVRLCGIQF